MSQQDLTLGSEFGVATDQCRENFCRDRVFLCHDRAGQGKEKLCHDRDNFVMIEYFYVATKTNCVATELASVVKISIVIEYF